MPGDYSLASLNEIYDIQLDWLVEAVREREPELVGLQFPDGLRDWGPAIASWLTAETGAECVISGDPSFGACDLSLDMSRVGVDLLVHFGHSPMPSLGPIAAFDTLFVPSYSKTPVDTVVAEAAARLKSMDLAGRAEDAEGPVRVGILTTAQHAQKIEAAMQVLRDNGVEPHIGFGDDRVFNPGQLLGCNFTAARTVAPHVDAFLYIGSGDFHPIAAAWGLEIPVLVADPYTGEVRDVNERVEALMRERHAAIARAQEAGSFGILVGTRVGQERMKLARGLAKLCRRHGKEAYLITLDFFSADALASFRHLDAFVNTGCPRITTDDYARYDQPMLTPPELEIVLGRRSWEDYLFDEFKGRRPAPHQEPDAIQVE